MTISFLTFQQLQLPTKGIHRIGSISIPSGSGKKLMMLSFSLQSYRQLTVFTKEELMRPCPSFRSYRQLTDCTGKACEALPLPKELQAVNGLNWGGTRDSLPLPEELRQLMVCTWEELMTSCPSMRKLKVNVVENMRPCPSPSNYWQLTIAGRRRAVEIVSSVVNCPWSCK